MTSKVENNEEESFIILGTSPGTSLDIKCNGMENGPALDKAQIEDAMKDLTMDASYKAHFNLADCPSPASVMAASTIITDDKTTEELQKRFGELLDENVVLKDTLKQNNDSLKEQFLLIASCQEDMLKTTMQHKDKFEETKILIEKLRQENKKLKKEISQLAESPSLVNEETGENKGESQGPKSGPPSAMEFVTSPDDDTVDKLTAQLELVEKQRRQVITDNEKLTWQKESLENIVDATTKERDDLKEKLKQVELQLSSKISDFDTERKTLEYTIRDLQDHIQTLNVPAVIATHEAEMKKLEERCAMLHSQLKTAKLELLKAEDIKMEFADYKSATQEKFRVQKDSLLEMHDRLKQATTTVFQPVRLSVGSENGSLDNGLAANVKLYDRALRHLAELLNKLTHGLTDSLMETLGVILSLYDYHLERSTEAQFKAGLATVKQQLENQQNEALSNIGQVRGTMTVLEKIFDDYKELVTKSAGEKSNSSIEALTSALVARGQDLQTMQAELNKLRSGKDDTEHYKVQLELYRSDFEAERKAREKMASEKDLLHTDLRKAQRKNEELTQQLEEVRRLNPGLHRTATAALAQPATSPAPPSPANNTTGNMVYKCPKCMRFSTDQMRVMEDHLDFCLDDF